MSFLSLVRVWIVVSALASSTGWILSTLGQLNRTGYLICGGFGLILLFLCRRTLMAPGQPFSWRRAARRFSRPLPLAFAGLAALVFLGGSLYAPNNYDGLTYRLPRVLHWLAQGQWQWIHTINNRMNDRSCGFEWLMTPVFLATQSDRALFLINYLPFLLLPGLVFSVFTRLGVTARVAWQWMWLLPTGYNFLLQAGSLANDAFAATYALAALDFALRGAASRRMSDVWFSLLAAALLTGAKSGNLPLLLPWFIAFLPLIPRLFSRLVPALLVILAALLVSFLPTAILNYLNCGDWTGLSLEKSDITVRNPLVGIVGNSIMLLLANFTPTFFPMAGWWNHAALGLLPGKIAALAQANFEGGFYTLGEIPTEEWSGLGFGLSCLLAASVMARLFQPSHRPAGALTTQSRFVLAAPYVSLLFFFAKSGMMTLARLVSAYYPLLLPVLLVGVAPSSLVRRRWWRRATFVVLLLACATVVLTPARPLWPVRTVLSMVGDGHANQPFLKRIKDVYLVYADRSDPLAQVRAWLPDDCRVVGFVGEGNDTEISLWRPYGHRRAVHILPGDSIKQIRARNIQYAVVGEFFLFIHHQTIQIWLQQHGAELVASVTATMTVSDGPRQWYIVRFSESAATNLKTNPRS